MGRERPESEQPRFSTPTHISTTHDLTPHPEWLTCSGEGAGNWQFVKVPQVMLSGSQD